MTTVKVLTDKQLEKIDFPATVKLRCVHTTRRELESHDPVITTTDRLLNQELKLDLGDGPIPVRVVSVPDQPRSYTRSVEVEESCPNAGKVSKVELHDIADPERACPDCGYFREVVE